jgi:NAD(P)-dependent dehydrogenase (short-subunit alcohol dehydrogenase family)
VITGGSSGIGAEVARLLTADGWRCVLVAAARSGCARVADELGAEAEVCDVGDRAAVDALAGRVAAPPSPDQAAGQQRRRPGKGRLSSTAIQSGSRT